MHLKSLKEFEKKSVFLFDGDGVLYTEGHAQPGAVNVVGKLRSRGDIVRLLTNNATVTRDVHKRRLTDLGMMLDVGEIQTSAFAAVKEIRRVFDSCGRKPRNSGGQITVFVVGEIGVLDACKQEGFRFYTGEERPELLIDAVIISLDKKFSFDKLRIAMDLIDSGALFVATNTDCTFPTNGGGRMPGAGALVATLVACVEKEPDIIGGKPSECLFRMSIPDGVGKESVIMTGDRFETDILGSQRYGIDSVLLRTGIASRYTDAQIQEWQKQYNAPTFVFNDMFEFLASLSPS